MYLVKIETLIKKKKIKNENKKIKNENQKECKKIPVFNLSIQKKKMNNISYNTIII